MSVHNGRSNTRAAAAELAEFRKNHNILRKNTLFNEHHVVYKRTTRDECEIVRDGKSRQLQDDLSDDLALAFQLESSRLKRNDVYLEPSFHVKGKCLG